MRQISVVFVEDFFGHAVVATEVATVRHADAQIVQRPAQAVAQQALRRNGLRRDGGSQGLEPLVDQGNHAFRHSLDFA